MKAFDIISNIQPCIKRVPLGSDSGYIIPGAFGFDQACNGLITCVPLFARLVSDSIRI